MEYLVIVAIVVIISLLDDRLRGKKKSPSADRSAGDSAAEETQGEERNL